MMNCCQAIPLIASDLGVALLKRGFKFYESSGRYFFTAHKTHLTAVEVTELISENRIDVKISKIDSFSGDRLFEGGSFAIASSGVYSEVEASILNLVDRLHI